MSNSSIWPVDRTISGATTLGLNGSGSYSVERVLRIPPNSSITGASPSKCFVLYPGHSFRGSYASAEIQSVYSTAPDNWATRVLTGNGARRPLEWIEWVVDVVLGRDGPENLRILKRRVVAVRPLKRAIWFFFLSDQIRSVWQRPAKMNWDLKHHKMRCALRRVSLICLE